ncbi:MAG: sugar ABC transporter ATP-binding protein [Rhizobiaceae bacterium]|nr:sugar ABC transporter ATP-binding protein [Rhizobiaceae bacterium]
MMVRAPTSPEPLITLDGVGKSFAGVRVLRNVSFSLRRGELVALVGENGAGKSTLKNILCGLLAPDEGTITVNGKAQSRITPDDARELGIAAIHQELSLFPNLSIAENIHMGVGSFPTGLGLLDRRSMKTKTRDLLGGFFEREIDPDEPVERLSLGERQLVEVGKALHRASAMLILDEPTTSLSLPERQRLFEVTRQLRTRGYALIYITHFMEEVYELADRIVVLRDGQMVGSGTPSEIDEKSLTKLMVGRELAEVDTELADSYLRASRAGPREPVLKVRDLSDDKLLNGVDLDLAPGEILGLAGLMGSGRSEVAQAIFGISEAQGVVEIAGERFESRTPQTAKAKGIALVSEDRRADQVFAGRSVRENLTSAIIDKLAAATGLLRPASQRTHAAEMAGAYAVRHPGLEAPIVSLSGGNQQKCIIARWLATEPRICILDEPTKGIDVGAKAEIHRLVAQLAEKGLGVLLISSDLPELLALSHRVLVMHKGHVVGGLERGEFSPAAILRMASTGKAA